MNVGRLLGLEDASRGEMALFFVTMGVMLSLGIVGFLRPSALSSALIGAKSWVLVYFGWWFILLGFVLLVAATAFTASRYGRIRIGGPDAEPEFDRFSWLSMVFTVGFGASVLIWGVAEPVSIVQYPPPDPAPVQNASTESMALAFMFIHEVFPGLAMWYLPVAIAFGIAVYTDGIGEYKISSMLAGVVDKGRIPGLYWLVDLAAMIATIGGIATTLGFSAQTMSAILSGVFGLEARILTYAVFALIGLVFLGDVWLGLRKGIRNAARATVVLIGVAMALLVVIGPTLYMLELHLDATGVWLSNLFRLSLYTAPGAEGNWAADWTGFWWAWWAAWSIFVGSFVARVSKGRTVRELFAVLVLVPTLFTWIQHGLIGGWALAPGYQAPIAEALAASGNPAAIAKALEITPYGTILAVLFVFIIAGYIITSLDSAVFMISAITLGDENPNPRNRAWWGALLAVFGMMSLELEEFSAIESLSVTMALPFSLFLLLVLYGSYVVARNYVRDNETPVSEPPTRRQRPVSESVSDDD
ncbi:BCCT transporter [Natrinema pellirubrum DSM 15624]|uniref:BCCT transporter n=1 Tax=Natrinema pellirubrum (strain DSM 15624 / CIP 106293 / JCM 10476 / NCIMB 786 / 157) TaxID=797303 RepID=L0JLL7_NATP1|nr:BCCT family transporter [Natrinema pellirubrum]AGB32174.1 choline-glycine betaine transporter [Natrinema pellirubrum DSM 15624]ELY76940.1 BCCT transporter [Natrinema pellirubrum DSM 15624]